MRSRSGMTVTELMIVIGIMGIGAVMSVSSLITVLPKWRLQGAATDVLTQLQYARSEAVRRNRPVIITFTGVGSSTSSAIGVYEDINRNSAVDAGELMRTLTIPTLYPKVYVSTVADVAGAVTQMMFGPDGMVRDTPTALTMPVTITLASPVATVTTNYQVIVSRSGIAKTGP